MGVFVLFQLYVEKTETPCLLCTMSSYTKVMQMRAVNDFCKGGVIDMQRGSTG